jgi:hypothetical protein
VTLWEEKFLTVRTARQTDLQALASFRCSTGPVWEQEVEDQIRGPLPHRYIGNEDPEFDPRLLVCTGPDEELLAVAAHHIETVPVRRDGELVDLRPTYIEVIAVALAARNTTVNIDEEPAISMGTFMFDAAITDVRQRPNRDPYVFARVDPRHKISLRFCDRVGLVLERPNEHPDYIQRWGDL